MDTPLFTIPENNPDTLQNDYKFEAINSLESGKIVYFPNYFFTFETNEQDFLSESVLHPKHKNISYFYPTQHLAGSNLDGAHLKRMQIFMHRYALYANQLIAKLYPPYTNSLIWGRTSYRPAEIKGRITSKRKDDTRVHIDSFPATPVNGLRILRVFCNVNPYEEPRVWQVGESFENVLKRFSPRIRPYNRTQAKFLKLVKATKTLRSAYDHYMLHTHDQMKLDNQYQNTLTKQQINFPSQSTWVVFTDHVSHAALSGQFLLEQTFYLPVNAMLNPKHSPLHQWEKEKSQVLI